MSSVSLESVGALLELLALPDVPPFPLVELPVPEPDDFCVVLLFVEDVVDEEVPDLAPVIADAALEPALGFPYMPPTMLPTVAIAWPVSCWVVWSAP